MKRNRVDLGYVGLAVTVWIVIPILTACGLVWLTFALWGAL